MEGMRLGILIPALPGVILVKSHRSPECHRQQDIYYLVGFRIIHKSVTPKEIKHLFSRRPQTKGFVMTMQVLDRSNELSGGTIAVDEITTCHHPTSSLCPIHTPNAITSNPPTIWKKWEDPLNLLLLRTTCALPLRGLHALLIRARRPSTTHERSKRTPRSLPRPLKITGRRLSENVDLDKFTLDGVLDRHDGLDHQGVGVVHVDVHERHHPDAHEDRFVGRAELR